MSQSRRRRSINPRITGSRIYEVVFTVLPLLLLLDQTVQSFPVTSAGFGAGPLFDLYSIAFLVRMIICEESQNGSELRSQLHTVFRGFPDEAAG